MNAKDNSIVTDFLAEKEAISLQTATLTHDINLSDDRRLSIVETSPDGKIYVLVIEDNEAGDARAAELTEYPVPESSSSSSSSSPSSSS